MQFPTLSSGVCGISLETGSKLVSWYYLVAGVVELILIITTKEYLVPGEESKYNYVCIVYLVGAAIVQIFNINLLVGLYMRRPSQMRPWIMTKFIFVALILVWFGMTKVAKLLGHEWLETPNLIGDIIGIFFQMVVYSHYREVIDQEKRGRNVNSSSELA